MSPLQMLKHTESVQSQTASSDQMRLRALGRLYARREAVDALIRSLEVYESTQQERQASCVPISAERKCS
jgi:hypothetical protein